MTIASPATQPLYTISGTGPYTVTNPYRDASDLRITAIASDVRTVLDPADYTISPQRGLTTGTVTLSSGAATTHAGAQLEILRFTPALQGWQGVNSSREAGIEAALDFAIMSQQDFDRDAGRALLLAVEAGVAPEIPQLAADRAGKFLGFDAEGKPTASLSGPTGTAVSSFMEAWLALTTQLAALNALGGTVVGKALFQAANPAAGRSALELGALATKAGAAVPVTRYYTAGATWTKPANLKYLEIEVWGGGGGSGSAGGTGGTSSLGTHAVATGGAGNAGAFGGVGGVGSTGDLLLAGTGGAQADGSNFGGQSGSAPRGAGGVPHTNTATAGNVPGGGGGSGGSNGISGAGGGYAFARVAGDDLGATETVTVGAGGSAGTGGAAGGAGMVIVTEVFNET